jgi:hypothetical protein
MKPNLPNPSLLAAIVLLSLAIARASSAPSPADAVQPRMLPGELTADQVLNGEYPYPPSPKVEAHDDWTGFAKDRLGAVPPPGVHPRILISPDDLPDLRRRLKETEVGKALYATLQKRLRDAIHNPADWSSQLYDKLAAGDLPGATALIDLHNGFPADIGHYQPWLEAIVLEAFDSMITQDKARGEKAATALTTYVRIIKPGVEKLLADPLGDDVSRAKLAGSTTGPGNQGVREGLGGHLIGYGYDFAYNFMTDAQRDIVRGLIADATAGELWMGGRLPHHFRNWNWIMVGMGQPLLSLAIEGEKGYDPRVYKLAVRIARDYMTYGITGNGFSTEAVGYTQFGLVWANPFMVAAARRGDNLLVQNHHRAMLDWYIHTLEPSLDHWTSHGDGGDGGPAIWTLSMWHYFYPQDPKAAFLWQTYVNASEGKAFDGTFHLVEPMLWATDDAGDKQDYAEGAKLGLPLTSFDPTRSSLLSRSAWNKQAAMMEFECRTDSVGASHEHADRGNFNFFALGRAWAKENFRSVESRHHNCILIDGAGQGYWPGPGKWLGLKDQGNILIAACDAKPAYDTWWPKEIITEGPSSFVRFNFPRWQSYRQEAENFRANYGSEPMQRDQRPSVVAHWTGFGQGDPRMWDEDTWPVALPHNPVQRAFRSVIFNRGAHPYLIIVDDIQKDDKERLYEWLMQTGMDTEMASMKDQDIILCDATVKRDESGAVTPQKGDRELLVRILDMNDPAKPHDYQTRPSTRLETFERKDTLVPVSVAGALSGSRSYGLDKRLVISSRSVAPDFKILLYPIHAGDPLPITSWNGDKTRLTIENTNQKETYTLVKTPEGRTDLSITPPTPQTPQTPQTPAE